MPSRYQNQKLPMNGCSVPQTVYLNATKACTNVIIQYNSDYKRSGNQNASDSKVLSFADRSCIHMQICVYRDYQLVG